MARRGSEDRKLAGMLKRLGVNVDGQQTMGNTLKSSSKYTSSDHATIESYQDRMARVRTEIEMAKERTELEAESVLFYIATRGKGFSDKECKQCKLPFAATYAAVSFCSNLCRFKSLAEAGIQWNPYGKTDSERWDGRIPKVLSPEAFRAAAQAVELMVEEEEDEQPEEEVVDESMIDVSEEDFDIMLQEIVSGELDED